jgi:hypothetical protein
MSHSTPGNKQIFEMARFNVPFAVLSVTTLISLKFHRLNSCFQYTAHVRGTRWGEVKLDSLLSSKAGNAIG